MTKCCFCLISVTLVGGVITKEERDEIGVQLGLFGKSRVPDIKLHAFLPGALAWCIDRW